MAAIDGLQKDAQEHRQTIGGCLDGVENGYEEVGQRITDVDLHM